MAKQATQWTPGAILSDAMYTMTELCARVGWETNDLCVALDKGLRFYRFADTTYVFGSDVMRFIKETAQTTKGDVS